MPAVVSKRGLMGTIKAGTLSDRLKRAIAIITQILFLIATAKGAKYGRLTELQYLHMLRT